MSVDVIINPLFRSRDLDSITSYVLHAIVTSRALSVTYATVTYGTVTYGTVGYGVLHHVSRETYAAVGYQK